MNTTIKVALLQLNSGPYIAENLAIAADMIRRAAADGAQFILTPENTCHMRSPQIEKLASSPAPDDHPVLPLFGGLAKELGVWIMAGSVSVRLPGVKIANRSLLFDAKGDIAAMYDKIHLFDVDLPTGEKHRESDVVEPGTRAVVADTPWGGVGMTICYDVRFAYLYRALAQKGARIITVPAAFTVPTGRAHWETLLRARAIETGSFILAPAQCGTHQGGRATYGHSLLVAPWGEVIADGGEAPGISVATLDMRAVDVARNAIPALKHDREFIF
jgi:predicted amidohydrolase